MDIPEKVSLVEHVMNRVMDVVATWRFLGCLAVVVAGYIAVAAYVGSVESTPTDADRLAAWELQHDIAVRRARLARAAAVEGYPTPVVVRYSDLVPVAPAPDAKPLIDYMADYQKQHDVEIQARAWVEAMRRERAYRCPQPTPAGLPTLPPGW